MSAFELIIIRDEPDSDISLLVDDEQYTLVVVNDPPEHEIAVQEVSDNEFELIILLDNVVINNNYYGDNPDALIKGNYLAEFSTELEKQQARQSLGIDTIDLGLFF